MPTKFFTNTADNTLFKKFTGVFENMVNLHAFYAIVGFFRASGYFAIREYLRKVPEVKILVGINVDKIIAEANRRGVTLFGYSEKTREGFIKWMQQDIKEARYERAIEQGILDFMQDIIDGNIKIRVHNSKTLHAKVYLFLPENFNEHSNGIVITGSSNLSAAGLGCKSESSNYELNVELRDYDDLKFARDEFNKLWNESTDILPEDFKAVKEKTHLDKLYTPYEIYIKFLIEYFDKNIDYDPETIGDVPTSFFKKLSYQVDAVNQGFNMLNEYDGFFLADVVGTGKTVVAAMLAKKFIITNGPANTKILIVYPPAVEKNWKRTFNLFGIDKYTKFISNGSLEKIIKQDGDDYWAKEEYDLILVDEAHKFRNHRSQMFNNLQLICKSGRRNGGLVQGNKKKVVLISATPLNNKPEDIYYQLLLFQNARKSNLPITNLQSFFGKIVERYRIIKRQDEPDIKALQRIYSEIREKILKYITIRRTRRDLESVPLYKEDLKTQGISFPKIAPPKAIEYKLDKKLNDLFYKTIGYLVEDDKLNYFRYQAIMYLKDDVRNNYYENAETVSMALAYIMKTMLVKRLESSFFAFKTSLGRFKTANERMINMFDKGKIFIAPDLDINKLLDEGCTEEEIEAKILEIMDEKPGNRIFGVEDFDKDFLNGLKHDQQLLDELCSEWDDIKDENDVKFDEFLNVFKNKLFDKKINPTGKLVIFTESKDTSNYLTKRLNEEKIKDILTISSDNRKSKFDTILANFDANYEKEHKNDYNIIISTEVLSEGINLHRANVIVNYDTPWNSTRLMQRLGRVNRIGSVAGMIYNFNFYPSAQSEAEIKLKKTAYIKLQGFHTAYGEDAQVYTIEEIIQQFQMYEYGLPEDQDIRLQYLQIIRDFKDKNPKEFKRIKHISLKARTGREKRDIEINENEKISTEGSSICFLKTNVKKEIYKINKEGKAGLVVFEEAAKIFGADANEKPVPLPDYHYKQISEAVKTFENEFINYSDDFTTGDKADARTNNVKKFLRELRGGAEIEEFDEIYDSLVKQLDEGTYVNLVIDLERLRKKNIKPSEAEKQVVKIAKKYLSSPDAQAEEEDIYITEPEIIISETFNT
ncbi:MAG: helicase [Ignavibacteriae bacterium]|nr:MAG: helicase [Ignavibacteriota bacterium]